MRLSTCFALFVLGLALVQAAPKIVEKKSLTEDAKLEKKTDLKIEEAGGEKDRSKKSATTFCVHIRPGSEPTQTSCNEHHPVQTLNVVQPQQVPQSSIVLPAPQPQPPQTVHIVQPAQPTPTVNIVRPAPEPKPEPAPQPAPQPAPVDVKPAPQPAPVEVKPAQVVVQPAEPLPEPHETLNVLPIAPACNEQVYALPSRPMVLVPEMQPQLATLVQVPTQQCNHHHHALVAQCSCQQKAVAEPLRTHHKLHHHEHGMQVMTYPSASYVRPPMVPCDPRALSPYVMRASNIDAEMKPGSPQARTHTVINMNGSPSLSVHRPSALIHKTYIHGVHALSEPEYVYPVRGYVNGGYTSPVVSPGLTINAYPQIGSGPFYRSASSAGTPQQQPGFRLLEDSLAHGGSSSRNPMASEVSDLMESTKKMPREIDTASETNEEKN